MNRLFDFTKFAEHTALIEESGQKVSYSQLQTIADGIAENIKPKSLVFCLCTNTVPSIAGYVSLFCCLMLRKVTICFNAYWKSILQIISGGQQPLQKKSLSMLMVTTHYTHILMQKCQCILI